MNHSHIANVTIDESRLSTPDIKYDELGINQIRQIVYKIINRISFVESMLHAVMLDLGNGDFVNELHQVLGDSKFASYFESALTNSDDNKTLFD